MDSYHRGRKIPQWLTKKLIGKAMAHADRKRAAEHGGPLSIGQEFLIDGGDGDQSFLGTPHRLRLVEVNWQCDAISQWGAAILLRIEGGARDGQYVAVTKNPGFDIQPVIAKYGSTPCVVHLVGSEADKAAGRPIQQGLGKSYIERMADNKAG